MITCYHCGRTILQHTRTEDAIQHYEECLMASNKRIIELEQENEALQRWEE